MKNEPGALEQQQALEYLLGQILLSIEADSAAIRTKLQRLEDAITQIAPASLAPPGEAEEYDTPFTMDSLGTYMQTCLERMRAHQSVRAGQMVAIGQLTERVLSLGEHLNEPELPEVGETARNAIAQAQHRKPEA